MKISNIITLRNIYFFAAIHCLVLIIICGVEWYDDTPSYLDAWESISNSNIDIWRTPTYPIIIGILKYIFGYQHYLLCITIIQHLTFLISIYYFHEVIVKLTRAHTIAIYLTAFYAIYPSFATWNCYILTESFTIYGMIFLLYCAFNAYMENSSTYIVGFAFWTIFLIFLRPSQVYILPVFLVGWLLLYVNNKKRTKVIIEGIISVCLSSFLLLYYCQCFKYQYGIFAPSGIGVVNKYYMARMDAILKPEYTNNESLKIYFTKLLRKNGQSFSNGTCHDLYVETFGIIHMYGLKEISELVSEADKNDYTIYLKRFLQRLYKASNDRLFVSYLPKWKIITDFFCVSMKIIYLLLIVYSAFIVFRINKTTQIPWFSITLFMLGFCHLFLIIATCQNSWDRLILPAAPVYIIMIGQLFSTITITKCPNSIIE